MNACSSARISSFRASVVSATVCMRSRSVLRALVVIPISTAPASNRFRPIFRPSAGGVGGPDRLLACVADGVLVSGPALASDADPDRPIEQYRPPHVMAGAQLAIGDRGPARAESGGVEVDEDPGGL